MQVALQNLVRMTRWAMSMTTLAASFAFAASEKGFVAEDPKPMSRRGSSASVARPNTELRFPSVDRDYFSISGKQFMILNRRARNGHILESNLISDDFTEIARDPEGRGFMNSWELVTPGRRIFMHQPRDGHFQVMDIEQVTPKVVYSLSFNRTTEGKYSLFRLQPRLRRPQLSAVHSKIIVGCEVAEKDIQLLAGGVSDMIKDEIGILDDQLKNPNGVLDSSCSTGDFAGKRGEAIKAGIKEVFESDNAWSKGLAKEVTESEKKPFRSVNTQGKYLQCLRYHRLDHHASRIESALATYLSLGSARFDWKIKCAKSPYENRGMDVWGSYLPADGRPPTIMLYDQPDSSGKIRDRGRGEPTYAKTFFHEMLHYSLIPEGKMQDAIDQCCTQENPDTTACKDLDRMALEIENKQRVANQACTRLESIEKGLCAKWHENVRKKMNDGQWGDLSLDALHTKIGSVYHGLSEPPRNCKIESYKEMSQKCKDDLKNGIDQAVNEGFFGTDKTNQEELREMARHIYGGSLGSSCPGASALNFWNSGGSLLAHLQGLAAWLLPQVSAASGINKCEISNGKGPNDWRNFPESSHILPNYERSMSPKVGNEDVFNNGTVMPFSYQNKDEMRDNSNPNGGKIVWGTPVLGSGSGPVSGPGSGSSPKRYPQRPSDGPPRTHYGTENGVERQQEISRTIQDYKRTSVAVDSLTAELIKGTVISEARAEVEPQRELENQDESPARKTGRRKKPSNFGSVDVSVKPIDIPDPLEHLTPSSSVGVKVADQGIGVGESAEKKSRLRSITGVSRVPASEPGANKAEEDHSVSSRPVVESEGHDHNQRSSLGGDGPPVVQLNDSDGGAGGGGAAAGKKGKPNSRANTSRVDTGKEKYVDLRAGRSLLKRLQDKRYASRVKPELSIPSVVKAMRRHLIQVKDDEGHLLGASDPKAERRLVYCPKLKYLVVSGHCRK
jgi:hypothetical protein